MLHPYYKLAYIRLAWGGPEEQAKERAAGKHNAKDWQDEARKILEKTVSGVFVFTYILTTSKMETYWNTRPKPLPEPPTDPANNANLDLSSHLSEFDRHRQSLVAQEDQEEGWAAELRRYLKDMPANVTKETDIVQWWQVFPLSF